MRGTFSLMCGAHDKRIGTFVIDSENNIWDYTAELSNDEQPLVFRLMLKDLGGVKLSGDAVHMWIAERAPDPDYEFIDALLERVGIKEYDPLAFVAHNRGCFITDNYYLDGFLPTD